MSDQQLRNLLPQELGDKQSVEPGDMLFLDQYLPAHNFFFSAVLTNATDKYMLG